MSNLILYPELIDYIFYWCDGFQTAVEHMAVKTFRHDQPGIKESVRNIYKAHGWISDEVDVKKCIDMGCESFKEKVATRIFMQHQHQLNLNLCPLCGKITRTPMAKQCRFCFHDWH
jgi:hypothetical protein